MQTPRRETSETPMLAKLEDPGRANIAPGLLGKKPSPSRSAPLEPEERGYTAFLISPKKCRSGAAEKTTSCVSCP